MFLVPLLHHLSALTGDDDYFTGLTGMMSTETYLIYMLLEH